MSKEPFENFWAPFAAIIGAVVLVINLLVVASGNRTFAIAAFIIVSLAAIIVGMWQYAFAINNSKPYTKKGKYGFEPKYRFHLAAKSIVYLAIVSLFFSMIYTLTFIEIIPDCCGFLPTKTPTPTATYTPKSTPINTVTSTITSTITPLAVSTPIVSTDVLTAQSSEFRPTQPPDYEIIAAFDGTNANGLGSTLKLTANDGFCTIEQVGGLLSIACKGSNAGFTIVPTSSDDKQLLGVAMSIRIPSSNNWNGKFQLQARYDQTTCDPPLRGYAISIRPSRFSFSVQDGKDHFNDILTPAPTLTPNVSIFHVIRIEDENGQIVYYLDDTKARSVSPENGTSWICWMFQSTDPSTPDSNAERSIEIDWIAVKRKP
jgi:hypothetical protein